MRTALCVAILSSTAARASAFLAATPAWPHAGASARRGSATPATAEGAAALPLQARGLPGSGGSAGTLLVGALAAGAALLVRRGRRAVVARRAIDFRPAFENMKADTDISRGPDYREWLKMKQRAVKKVGRQRFFKQQQILRESGITCAKGGYHKWFPNRDKWNMYKGPESHPDNPWFPAASPGYGRGPGKEAVHCGAPAQLGATAAPCTHASTFTGGSSKRFWRTSSSRGSALVLHAHKKTSASTKNQGHHLLPHFWGLTKHGYQGAAVKAGTRLLKQKGMKWYAGKNVLRAKDYSLVALRDGIVQWRGEWRHREVSVLPWEYVREKCVWTNPNTLGPKEYEPWMGSRTNSGKRHYVNNLRNEWLESEKGQEWLKKKEEKKEKQKAIQKKIRTYLKEKKKGKVPAAADAVAVGGDSESEA